jgi:peptide/nickel transport system permease protein
MFAYIVRRLFSGLVMLIVMSFVTMLLFFSSAVDPARVMCGKSCTPERIEQTRKALGYDKPAFEQWTAFLGGVVKGREYPADAALRKAAPQLVQKCDAPCLGYSQVTQQMVAPTLWQKLPVTGSLALAAFFMWMIVGVGLGIVSALFKGTLLDRFIVGSSLLFYAFPTFALGVGLYVFLALKWHLVKIPTYTPISEGVSPWLQGLFLPSLTLALVYIAGYVRLTRAFVLESMSEDYLRTAKAKGLAPRKILFKHTMRAALTPVVTAAGLDLGGLLGGAIITETIFNYDGLGKLAVLSNAQYDLPMIVGIVLIAATFIILANLIVDLLYALIDPRVKYA